MTEEERLMLDRKISEMEIGVELVLEEIFGQDWIQIENPTEFGKEFKLLVLEHELDNIEFVKIKSNNHNVYTRVN
jgi:hypothetical protein